MLPVARPPLSAGMPNMPTFWYALRVCATLNDWVSFSNVAKPSLPKKPCARFSVWQPLQLNTVSLTAPK